MKIEIRCKGKETQEFSSPEGDGFYQEWIRRRGCSCGPNAEYRYGLVWGSVGGRHTIYLTEAEFSSLVTQLASLLLESAAIANRHNDEHFEEWCESLFEGEKAD